MTCRLGKPEVAKRIDSRQEMMAISDENIAFIGLYFSETETCTGPTPLTH
jgi:hypothetical protein